MSMKRKEKMVPTTVYLEPETKRQLKRAATIRRCNEADLIRQAIDEGLAHLQQREQRSSTAGLLKLAEFAKQVGTKGPRDLSTNLDTYLWDT